MVPEKSRRCAALCKALTDTSAVLHDAGETTWARQTAASGCASPETETGFSRRVSQSSDSTGLPSRAKNSTPRTTTPPGPPEDPPWRALRRIGSSDVRGRRLTASPHSRTSKGRAEGGVGPRHSLLRGEHHGGRRVWFGPEWRASQASSMHRFRTRRLQSPAKMLTALRLRMASRFHPPSPLPAQKGGTLALDKDGDRLLV